MTAARKIARYGWIKDLPDHRDLVREPARPETIAQLPPSVDLRPQCPPVYDQGQLGSCTANAIAGAIQFDQAKLVETAFTPSRLFIYYNERQIEGTTASDSGAQIRDGIKSVASTGYCTEQPDWPYDPAQYATVPPANAYSDAILHKVSSYEAVAQDLDQLRACLAAGFPFVFGFSVYESFESAAVASSGIVPMPGKDEAQLGGHAVVAVGYDDQAVGIASNEERESGAFIVRNSWGPSWALSGYFMLPYAYVTDGSLASDMWTIRTAS